MAYVKIEPSGCHERNGIIQVRLDFFLDEGDYRYNDFHIKTLDLPEDEKGKVLINNDEEYQEELKTKPFKWVDAPFHIHLIYVSEDTPDSEIDDIAEDATCQVLIYGKIRSATLPALTIGACLSRLFHCWRCCGDDASQDHQSSGKDCWVWANSRGHDVCSRSHLH